MESELDLRQLWALIRHWLWAIVSCALLAAVIVFVVTSHLPPVYQAAVTLMIQQSPSAGASDYTDVLASERQARTYAEIAKEEMIVQTVIGRLGLEMTPGEVAGMVSVELVPNTRLIRVSVEDSDPYRAPRIANGIADALIEQNQALQDARYADSLNNVREQMDEMTALMGETQAAIDALGTPAASEEQAELARLQTDLAGYRNSYASLLQSYEQMRLAARSADNIVILRRAQEPARQKEPPTARNALSAGLAAAVLVLGMVFLIDYLDDTIKTPDDVSRLLGMGTLGAVGRLENRNEELVTLSHPLSPMSEAFRRLRTNIRFASVDRPIKTLLITSADAVEGKSLTASNLAVSMAQAGLKVIIVDADLRRPRMHEIFGLRPQDGLTGALLDGSPDGRLQPVQQEGLKVLPAGELPPNPAELLGSRRMRELLDLLSQQADVVLLDSPPLLPVTDAAVLAREVDGVLLLVDSGNTRRGAARQAIESLRQVGANVIGVVLNKVANGRDGYYYYYHYHYHDQGTKKRGLHRSLLSRLRRRNWPDRPRKTPS